MVSVAKASPNAIGEWKLKEVRSENDAEPLSITGNGRGYVLKLLPVQSIGDNYQETLSLSIKVGNSMRSTVEILEEDEITYQHKIKVGFMMSTRMMPGSEEKRKLEKYLSDQLPKMTSMEIKDIGGEEYERLLVLASEGGARIVCEPSKDSEE